MNTKADTSAVWEVLRGIPDPEFGINIVDLGLVYSVECDDDRIAVTMTLTTPTCPSGGWIYEGTKAALRAVGGTKDVTVSLVFDPPWTTEMLSAAARTQLGWHAPTQ